LTIYAISDPSKISEIEEDLDTFTARNSTNPFMLSGFIKTQMEVALRKDSIPIVLVFMTEGKIIGLAPLLLRRKFGINFITLLVHFAFSPDFVFDPTYSEVCIRNLLKYMFNRLRCRIVSLDLPAESSNLRILKRMCEANKIGFRNENDVPIDHAIVPVKSTWSDFQKSKSKSFIRKSENIERRLANAGRLNILRFENEDNEQDALGKITDIEEASWKQNWRVKHHYLADENLLNLWEASNLLTRSHLDFKRRVWMLELNDQPVAYNLALLYKGTAYMFKTSYKNQYRKFYPGIYINNIAIRDLFDSGNVQLIDFMTNLPFHKRWTSKYLVRVRFLMWKGFLAKLIRVNIVALLRRLRFEWILTYG
jgi:CelD/BcsL family acetyltransferase involved in cellulose biosynthesis